MPPQPGMDGSNQNQNQGDRSQNFAGQNGNENFDQGHEGSHFDGMKQEMQGSYSLVAIFFHFRFVKLGKRPRFTFQSWINRNSNEIVTLSLSTRMPDAGMNVRLLLARRSFSRFDMTSNQQKYRRDTFIIS